MVDFSKWYRSITSTKPSTTQYRFLTTTTACETVPEGYYDKILKTFLKDTGFDPRQADGKPLLPTDSVGGRGAEDADPDRSSRAGTFIADVLAGSCITSGYRDAGDINRTISAAAGVYGSWPGNEPWNRYVHYDIAELEDWAGSLSVKTRRRMLDRHYVKQGAYDYLELEKRRVEQIEADKFNETAIYVGILALSAIVTGAALYHRSSTSSGANK